uniref:hypothetical protein n=1 Tax=Staphylococcus hominis TaxID=1290 RepID=UPI001643828F
CRRSGGHERWRIRRHSRHCGKEVNDVQGNVSDMVPAFEDQGLKVVDYEDNFPEAPITSDIRIYAAMDVDDAY